MRSNKHTESANRSSTRSGFTLVEVLIALVVLSLMILGLTTATAALVHNATKNDRMTSAIELAEDRIQTMQIEPDYSHIETYVGTESSFPTLTGFTRQTSVVRVGGVGLTQDYKRITVIVNGPGLSSPVERSVTVGAP